MKTTSLNQKKRSNERPDYIIRLDQQAAESRSKYLQKGILISASDCRKKLGISRQELNNAEKEERIFSLEGPSGTRLYPAFFTELRYNRQDLERVSMALGDMPGASKWQFFMTRKGSLESRSPLDALVSGDLEKVLVAAAGFRDR